VSESLSTSKYPYSFWLKFTTQTKTLPNNLDYNSPYVSAIYITTNNFNSDIFIIIHILFYYSTVNFNQKLYGFETSGVIQTCFDYKYVLVVKEIILAMAT